MTTEIRDADLADPADAAAIVDLVSAYASDPLGGDAPLGADVQARLVPGLRAHPTTLVLLAFEEGRAVGVAVCFFGFSTFAARPLLNVHDLAVLAGGAWARSRPRAPRCAARGAGARPRLLQAHARGARGESAGPGALRELRARRRGRRELDLHAVSQQTARDVSAEGTHMMQDWLLPYAATIWAMGIMGGLVLVQLIVLDVAGIRVGHVPGTTVTGTIRISSSARAVRMRTPTRPSPRSSCSRSSASCTHAAPGALNLCAAIYVVARVAHMLCYYADWKLPRSGAFLVAFLALVGMLVIGAAAALR